jgi:hypothetical protein
MRSNTDSKAPRSAGKQRVRVRRAVVGSASAGVITLGADDFAQLEACMNQDKEPSPAMVKAAALHRSLTAKR